MSIIGILLVIAIVGVVVWLLSQAPMHPLWKNVLIGVSILLVLLWLLSAVGGVSLPAL